MNPVNLGSLALADQQGRLLLTKHEGRLIIVLPTIPEEQQADWVARILAALESAGMESLVNIQAQS